MIVASLLVAAALTGEPVRAVLVSRTGSVRVTQVPATVETRDDVTHAWVWSGNTPVLRVEPQELADADALRARFREERSELDVRVRSDLRPDELLTLVAAPVEMWSEVPEELLPRGRIGQRASVARARNGSLRLRAFDNRRSSPWTTVHATAASVALAIHPATDLTVEVHTENVPLEGGSLEFLEPGTPMVAPSVIARFAASGARIRVPAAPPMSRVIATIGAERHARSVFEGATLDLPRKVALSPGVRLSGRFVSSEGEPLAAIEGTFEAWLSPRIPHPIRRRVKSGPDGRWVLDGATPGEAALLIETPEYGRVQRSLTLGGERVDLGDIVLQPPVRLQLVVRDGREPVKDAVVRAGGREVRTDESGVANLRGLHADEVLRLVVTAEGYVPAAISLQPRLPDQQVVQLERSVRVHGVVVGDEGSPAGADLQVVTGHREREGGRVEGAFSLDLTPGSAHELVFSAPDRQELRVAVDRGEAGETRDLGEVVLRRGASITGTIVSGDDGQPVAGATVWTLRPAASILSWARNQRLDTVTSTDGTFRLEGCELAPYVLRVDAPAYARAYAVADPRETTEVGTLTLSRGVTVRVAAPDGSQARLDLRGEGEEADIVSAMAEDGVALLRHIPAGDVQLSVRKGRAVLCEKSLQVPADRAELETRCDGELPLVHGQVLVAGKAAPGLLQWQPQRRAQQGLIVGHTSRAGLVQQQVAGESASPIVVPVADDGTFKTREISEGSWRVVWLPDAGGAATPREVVVTDAREQDVLLTFGPRAVRGRVVDREGNPAALATVTLLESPGSTITDAAGGFTIAGLEPGTYSLRARQRNDSSSAVSVEVGFSRDTEGVELRLDRSATAAFSVAVVDGTRRPAAGAFVFLEADSGIRQTAVTNSNGRAEFHLPAGAGERRRAAALHNGAWTFGAWVTSDTTMLRGAAPGDLLVETERASGSAELFGADGWNVTRLLSSIGAVCSVAAERPLRVSGLSPGPWVVTVAGVERQVTVKAGAVTRVVFP